MVDTEHQSALNCSVACHSQPKRKPIRRPGLAEFARQAGVTLSHARRCIVGERVSNKLLTSYRAWQRAARQHQTNPTAPKS